MPPATNTTRQGNRPVFLRIGGMMLQEIDAVPHLLFELVILYYFFKLSIHCGDSSISLPRGIYGPIRGPKRSVSNSLVICPHAHAWRFDRLETTAALVGYGTRRISSESDILVS